MRVWGCRCRGQSHRLPLFHLELGWGPQRWKKSFKKELCLFILNHKVSVKRLSQRQFPFSRGRMVVGQVTVAEIHHFHLSVATGHPLVTGVLGCKPEWKMCVWLWAESADVAKSRSPASAAALIPRTTSAAPCTPDCQHDAPLPTRTPVHSTL